MPQTLFLQVVRVIVIVCVVIFAAYCAGIGRRRTLALLATAFGILFLIGEIIWHILKAIGHGIGLIIELIVHFINSLDPDAMSMITFMGIIALVLDLPAVWIFDHFHWFIWPWGWLGFVGASIVSIFGSVFFFFIGLPLLASVFRDPQQHP